MSLDFWEIISVFLSCTLFFGKVGLPAAVFLFDFDFVKSMSVSCAGGITGTVLFTYLSNTFLVWWTAFKRKLFPNSPKKKTFSWFNRLLIKVKTKFGLIGLALITPLFLSIPIGAFICTHFYKNKPKVVAYISLSIIVWGVLLYFILLLFYTFFRDWLA